MTHMGTTRSQRIQVILLMCQLFTKFYNTDAWWFNTTLLYKPPQFNKFFSTALSHFPSVLDLFVHQSKSMTPYRRPQFVVSTSWYSPSCCQQGCGRTGRWPAYCHPWPWPLRAETFQRRAWKWSHSHRKHTPGDREETTASQREVQPGTHTGPLKSSTGTGSSPVPRQEAVSSFALCLMPKWTWSAGGDTYVFFSILPRFRQ